MSWALLTSLTLGLGGCGHLSGLDASDEFACPRPNGVPCQSLTDTYQASLAQPGSAVPAKNIENTVTGDSRFADATDAAVAAPLRREVTDSNGHLLFSEPQRVPEKLITVFIAPWTDSQGNLHEGETIYTAVQQARWAVDARRAQLAREQAALNQRRVLTGVAGSTVKFNPAEPAEVYRVDTKRNRAQPADTGDQASFAGARALKNAVNEAGIVVSDHSPLNDITGKPVRSSQP